MIAGLLLSMTLGCGSQDTAERPQDPQAERARDSVLAESNLPGAAGVKKALDVADSAAARRARLDSALREP